MTETQELIAPDGMEGDALGDAVAMSGDTVAIARRCIRRPRTCSRARSTCSGPPRRHRRLHLRRPGHLRRPTDDDGVVSAATATGGQVLDLRLKQSASVWRERGGHRAKRPVGTTFSFTLSAPATVTLAFTRRTVGRRAGGRCVAPTRANARRAHCTRAIAAGAVKLKAKAGATRVRFSGHVAGVRKPLPAGTYAVAIKATDASGHSATARPLTFTIAR